MISKKHWCFLLSLILAIFLVGCDVETLSTMIAPPAQTVASQGGSIAQTQAAKLLQAAQVRLATESALLKETAKVEAATAAAEIIDTAQARLVTQSAGKVTAAPTLAANLKDTAQAFVETQVVGRSPALKTQAAILAATMEVRLATEAAKSVPLALTQVPGLDQKAPTVAAQAADVAGTARAALETQDARLNSSPVQPTAPQDVIPTIVVYQVREGDTLPAIANKFGIPIEKIIFLNQYRYPWLAASPQDLSTGMSLVMAAFPGNNSPVIPSGQAAWSDVPGCNVAQVDWLLPPINCRPAQIDVVERVTMTVGCISLQNPLGYTLNHEIISGWMLSGADGVSSYGWFADHDRNAVIIGPAIVMEINPSIECRPPASNQ